mmetsp:Transcript_6863/g.20224  ORF Transcript_6863/g.20224 Transcript_6863/m.20224 type:complete len:244 (-) Transcript_6863:387-1118(-)
MSVDGQLGIEQEEIDANPLGLQVDPVVLLQPRQLLQRGGQAALLAEEHAEGVGAEVLDAGHQLRAEPRRGLPVLLAGRHAQAPGRPGRPGPGGLPLLRQSALQLAEALDRGVAAEAAGLRIARARRAHAEAQGPEAVVHARPPEARDAAQGALRPLEAQIHARAVLRCPSPLLDLHSADKAAVAQHAVKLYEALALKDADWVRMQKKGESHLPQVQVHVVGRLQVVERLVARGVLYALERRAS